MGTDARALLVLGWLALTACSRHDPRLGAGFTDNFERAEIGADYENSGAPYRIESGKLVFAHVHNHALWLRRALPHDVKVEFDVQGKSPDGDIKVELFGDGKSFESDEAVQKDLTYTATGYVFIFGGWRNSRSVLVRQNEHAWQHDRSVPLRTVPRVVPGRTYHFTIIRRGGHIDWQIDDKPFLAWDDAQPLAGPGHDHFGFDGWESECVFDNLSITPL